MSTSRNAASVGFFVLLTLVLIGGMFAFFRSTLFKGTYSLHVRFDDASGLLKDVPVQFAGVQIGRVSDITLRANRADVTLEIEDKYKIPRGSQFVIATPLLGTTSILNVVPPPGAARYPNAVIPPDSSGLAGQRSGDLTASLSQANGLIGQLTQTAKTADRLLSATTKLAENQSLQTGLTGSVANINRATANAAKLSSQLSALLLADNAQIQGLLRQTRVGSQVALSNIGDTTGQIRQITRENRAQLNAIVTNLNDTTASVAAITGQTSDLLKSGDIQKNLVATTANLKTVSDNLAKLSGDQGLQGDLRATLTNIRESTEKTNTLLGRLNRLAGVKPKTAAVVVGPGGVTVVAPAAPAIPKTGTATVPLFLPRADFAVNLRAKRFRSDVDVIAPIPSSPTSFARVGIYGIGDQSRAILQAGSFLKPGGLLDYRAGLYASKLSVGGDYGLGKSQTLSAEFYDPNKARLDVRGVQMFGKNLGLIVGGEDLTRKGGFVFGLQYRRSK